MSTSLEVAPAIAAVAAPSNQPRRVAVGASHAFDPGADGLASIYATRLLDRGIDPRALCAEIRADRQGHVERGRVNRALMRRPRVAHFGRGTGLHLQAAASQSVPAARPSPANDAQPGRTTRGRSAPAPRSPMPRLSRRFAAAGLAILLFLPIGVIVANAQEAPRQARYIVQAGDTLEGVALEFGVDPTAILAASAIQNPPHLTVAEVIVIPDPAESPDAAAWNANQRRGSSPFVIGAHDVVPGETLAQISGQYGLDPWALATFNGVSDIDALGAGQRLRVPLTDSMTSLDTTWSETAVASEDAGWQDVVADAAAAPAVGGPDAGWAEPAPRPVFAVDAPAYMQQFSLSCEYAAAYIATAAFGAGVPESAFMERISLSANPHWGYRGDIHGLWGGTDDYGIYPEALVPTLNEFGFVADVFYGGEAASLTSRIDAGMPVITWLGYFGDTAWQQEDEGSYLLAAGMHVVTVYGYDEGGVYLSNPGRGNHDYYAWGDFLEKWAVLDGMALAVAPM